MWIVNDAVAGGLVAGLLFEGMKAAFGAYLRQVPTYKLVYGAFASFPIFLLWIYFSWLIILVGAELTAAMPYLRSGGVKRRRLPGNQFVDAVQLLRLLHKAHQKGEVPSLQDLRTALRLPVEECEGLLERLAGAGWAARAANDHWVLGRDADEIRVAEVYHEFVFRSQELHADAEATFERQLVRLDRRDPGRPVDDAGTAVRDAAPGARACARRVMPTATRRRTPWAGWDVQRA